MRSSSRKIADVQGQSIFKQAHLSPDLVLLLDCPFHLRCLLADRVHGDRLARCTSGLLVDVVLSSRERCRDRRCGKLAHPSVKLILFQVETQLGAITIPIKTGCVDTGFRDGSGTQIN